LINIMGVSKGAPCVQDVLAFDHGK
jgi:hypothetical protein